MAIESGRLASITFDDYFIASDGAQYRVAFGEVFVMKAEDLLGFKPKNSADWFVQIGTGNRAILLAGCKIHSVNLCFACPPGSFVWDAR